MVIDMNEVTCQCGAVYDRTERSVMMRDKDRYQCDVCGVTLESWNGGCIINFKLLKRPEAS
jgi:predicted SprT family Zn-dependent metalloprotease